MLGSFRQGVRAAARTFVSDPSRPSQYFNIPCVSSVTGRLAQLPSNWSNGGPVVNTVQQSRAISMSAVGVNGVLGVIMPKTLVGSKRMDAVAAGERSVGSVHRGKLRGNIREAWDHREIQRLTAARDPNMFDDFGVGDHVVVRCPHCCCCLLTA
jgi:hypothetical protein